MPAATACSAHRRRTVRSMPARYAIALRGVGLKSKSPVKSTLAKSLPSGGYAAFSGNIDPHSISGLDDRSHGIDDGSSKIAHLPVGRDLPRFAISSKPHHDRLSPLKPCCNHRFRTAEKGELSATFKLLRPFSLVVAEAVITVLSYVESHSLSKFTSLHW